MEFQSPVLVITTIKKCQEEPLIAYLTELNHQLWHAQVNPFGEFNKQHFARWVVINQQLIFAAAVDGAAEDYLEALAKHCHILMTDIYSHCEQFPETGHPSPETIATYLLNHQQPTQMFYHGLRNRTVNDVQTESEVHKTIEVFLDGNQDSPPFTAKSPEAIFNTIKAHVKGTGLEYSTNNPYFFERLPPEKKHALWWQIPMLIIGILMIVLMMPIIRWKERQEKKLTNLNPFLVNNTPKDLDFEETQATQSPMTSIVAIKPGKLRQFTLRATLWALQVLADHYYNKGKLGSIGSIHFARWAIINEGRHLLFISNYDGSWESYLGDFIDRAALGLTAVWGNAVGFPPPKYLLWGGAAHADAFKVYAKRSQVVTHFWYSAYPHVSMANKLNNKGIRSFLLNPKRSSAKRWLKRF